MNGVVGVLALQGAFAAHCEKVRALGVACTQVRTVEDLSEVSALIIPGGESSTMSKLLVASGLFETIRDRIKEGMPVFGTCAGMILLAKDILDGRDDQRSFSAIDMSVRRNAYGRQIDSFEDEVETSVGRVHGVFIRAPKIEQVGQGVEVLGTHRGEAVFVRQKNALACSFHPELTNETRVHQFFIENMMMKEQV